MLTQQCERKVGTFNRDQIDYYWKDILPLLGSVPIFSELYSGEFVLEQLRGGDWQIWALSDDLIRGVVITEIRQFPKAKTFNILAAAGKFLEFFDEMESMFEWLAKDSGCLFIQAQVRPGVERKLRSKGPQIRSVVLTRRIVEGIQ